MTSDLSTKLRKLLGKLTSEVDKTKPGSDQDQFSVMDLFIQLRKSAAGEAALAAFQTLANTSAQSVIEIVESGKAFTQENIDHLKGALTDLKHAFEQSAPTAPETPAATEAPTVAAAETTQPKPPAQETLPLPEETPLVMDIDGDGDILREFVNEGQEHLENIEQGVLALETDPKDADVLNKVFRAFHTFKGGAGFLNLIPISSLAHTFESLLDLARKGELVIDRTIAELILEGGDLLKQYVIEMQAQLSGKKPRGPFILPTEAIKAKARAVIESHTGKTSSAATPKPAATSATGGVKTVPTVVVRKPVVVRPPASASPPPSPAPPTLAAQEVPPPAPPAAAPKPSGKPTVESGTSAVPTAGGSSVKVDTLKLDTLVDLVGELVIAQSFVAQHPDLKAISNQFFTRSMSQLGRITKELQRTAMSMRMVPIGSTFQKMQRIVRDVATKQQKQVHLVLNGEDTELDRTIVESIGDPLMHMIRNSVDHGIEKPDVRAARGKPAGGTVHLRAFHQSGNIVIQIQDDGNGLDRERIFKKAVEKGVVQANAQLTDEEIYHFIFAPGFSTAEVVSDISGRGVGMDVVKRNIEKLQGKVEIESELGKGSTFSIYLPLTLAIIEALVVSVGDQRYIIPALSVRESFQLTPAMLSTVYNRGEMVKVRDRLIPLLRLYEHFNIKPRSTNPTEGIVIVLEAGRAARCLLVDQLLHKQEVVIKSLGETMKKNQALAGAAILGDGRVGLILDVNALVQLKSPSLQMAA